MLAASPIPPRVPASRLGVEALALAAGVAALGRVIVGPLGGFPAEDRINTGLAARRTPTWNRVTWALSTYSDTVPTIVTALAVGAWRWRRRGSAVEAARPVAAIAAETAVFLSAAAVVGRPRPDVAWLDRPAPTSSFPSGHTGATTALHLTLADLVAEKPTPGRRFAAGVIRFAVPPLVAWSRLYRGMHHPSDVLVGLGVGVWSYRAVRRGLGAPGAEGG